MPDRSPPAPVKLGTAPDRARHLFPRFGPQQNRGLHGPAGRALARPVQTSMVEYSGWLDGYFEIVLLGVISANWVFLMTVGSTANVVDV